MDFPTIVKNNLVDTIKATALNKELLAREPQRNFTRRRKITSELILEILICLGSKSLHGEMLQYFNLDAEMPSVSAFCQQRSKISSGAMPHIFHCFNDTFPRQLYKNKYYLTACDGSTFCINRNPEDRKTYIAPDKNSQKGSNQLHVVAMYDLVGRRYTDAVIQPIHEKNEYRAICDMVDRSNFDVSEIIVADRGFGSYNTYAHMLEAGKLFLVRTKDSSLASILGIKLKDLPEGEMDQNIEIIISRSLAKKNMQHPELAKYYRRIAKGTDFDFIGNTEASEYRMKLRLVCFQIDGNYVNLVTNLPAEEFSLIELKELYHLRWGIETSFRELKYTIGAVAFHARKYELIEQEIWARLTAYNYCSIIIRHVDITDNTERKHKFQVAFCAAMEACMKFLRDKAEDNVCSDLEGHIKRLLAPVRPSRRYERSIRPRKSTSGLYRAA